jgi:hypothetical protein
MILLSIPMMLIPKPLIIYLKSNRKGYVFCMNRDKELVKEREKLIEM